jgi:catechol 2,3-dioxygenase
MARKLYISHLAHAEIRTPKLDASVAFFQNLMGMEITGREGQSVYLRCWGEYYHHSLVLTAGAEPALGHIGWRTHGPDELLVAVQQIEASGQSGEWLSPTLGHGRAYRFQGPGGHVHELFWDVERYQAPPELKSTYPARPQRYTGRGAAARQIDHVTVTSRNIMQDVAWYRDTLGFRFMEYIALEDHNDLVVFAQTTTNEKSHDYGMVADFSEMPGRVNHVAFYVQSHEEVLRAADILLEAGVPIEYGPGVHGMGEQTYLYFREPGGMRIEFNAGGYRNYVPDWEVVKWYPSQGGNSIYRNLSMPDSMTESFPPAPVPGLSFPDPAGAIDLETVNPFRQQGRV